LYTTHRDVLDEINAAAELPDPTVDLGVRIEELESANSSLRAELQKLHQEQRALATENLSLLHRVQVAEARLSMRLQK
jgi:FtsZ-binding cell division protein ZapB